MSQYRRSEVVSGLFIALAALVFALFAFKIGRFDVMNLFAAESVRCRTFFLDIKTLQPGSKVRVGGRVVGEITDLRLVEGTWPTGTQASTESVHRLVNEVTFELTYPELRLDPESAQVTIAQESLLSPHFLVLDPGRWPAGEAPRALFEADLPDVLRLPSGEGAGVDELLAAARPAIEELASILRTLNHEVLSPDNRAAFGRVLGRLDLTLEEGHQIAGTLNRGVLAPDNVEALDRMIHSLDEAAVDGRAVAARLEELLDPERDPRLDTILTEVAATTRQLRENLDSITTDLQRLLQNADRVVDETESELAESTRRLQRALWQGEMALRKIRANPAVLLFGDDETDLEARDLDLTEIRLRGRARPYEQRDEREKP